MRITKLAVAIAISALGVGILLTHRFDQLYPSLIVAKWVALLAITSLAFVGIRHDEFVMVLITIIAVAVAFRVWTFTFPASVVGIDPLVYGAWTEELLESGSTVETSIQGFYARASAFLMLSASFALVGDLDPMTALGIYPIAGGVILPVFAAIYVRQIGNGRSKIAMVLAAVVVVAGASSLRFQYWPIAQTLGALYYIVFVYTLARYLDRLNLRFFLLFLLPFSGLIASHKFTLFIAAGTFGFLIGLFFLQRFMSESTLQEVNVLHTVIVLGILTGVALYFQLEVTHYTGAAIFNITEPLIGGSGGVEEIAPTAAIPSVPLEYSGYYWTGNILLLMFVAGIAWLLVASRIVTTRDLDPSELVILAATATVAIAVIQSFVIGVFGPQRAVQYGEVALASLIIGGLFSVYRFPPDLSRSTLSVVMLVFLLVTAGLSAPYALPDYDNYPRVYLTAGEQAGIEFAETYSTDEVATDYYVRRVASEGDSRVEYIDGTIPLLRGEINDSEYVLYRSSVEVYLSPAEGLSIPFWELTWEPEETLNAEYHRVYGTSDATLYRNTSAM